MKASNKKILITVISFLFVLLLAIAPMTAFAEVASFDKVETDGTTATYGAYVYSKGVDISPFDGDFSEETVYRMTVSHSRTAISSFQMAFRMPYFVDVKNVYASDALSNNGETAVFEWHTDEKGYVNVSYSSPYNVAETDLFTVEFTLNSTNSAYENVECVYSEFVDENIKTVNAEIDLGYVSIGVAEIIVMGDVNGDMIVNLADLLIIQRSIVNKGYALTDEQFAVADINRDGQISMVDCQYIQNFLVGKLDSLENVNSATYSIDVLIKDQNGEWLYNGSFVAREGELYSTHMTPIFASLSRKYNITGNLFIESDVYGTVDPDSNGEGFVVRGKDYIVMTVNVNYGNEGEKIYVTGCDLYPYELTVPVGTSPEALLTMILSDAKFVLYLSDGSSFEVELTEDMLDLSNIRLDAEGYCSVYVNYHNSEFGYDVGHSLSVNVVPDTSKWQHIGTYTFVCDGYNAFEWDTVDFYVEAVVIDGEEFCEWTATEDGIVSISQEGVTVLMQLDEQNKTISFYKPNDALIGAYTFFQGDMTMTFDVYGQYGGAGDYVTCVTQTMIGDGGMIMSAGFTSYVRLDLENRILYPEMMRREFVINADNSLSMKECEHEWHYDTQAPTCTNPGWKNQYCVKCGVGAGGEIPPLGHSVGADGYCHNCGEYVGSYIEPDLDAEFLAYRTERMATVKADWYNTIKRYPEAAEMYQIRFDRLYSMISNATNHDELNRYCDELYNVINEINAKFGSGSSDCSHNNVGTIIIIGDCYNDGYDETFCHDCGMVINHIITTPAGHIYNEKGMCERCGQSIGGGEIIEDYIQMIQADFDMISITVNDTEADLINKLVGQKFYVYYSQSGMVEMTVTEDMIVDLTGIPFGIQGGGEGRIDYFDKNGNPYPIHFQVVITPDLTGVKHQTDKVVNGDVMGLYELKVYENGVVLMSGDGMVDYPGNYTVASFKENVILFDMDGGYLVFELGEGVADFYKPEAELDYIKTFYMSMPYISIEMAVYGDYTGAGDYVAVMTVTEHDPESDMQYSLSITTMVYLDMDNSVVRHVMFGSRNYDEAGNMYCNHTNTHTEVWEGDCWNGGYKSVRCMDCGEEISSEFLPPLGHIMNESGYCDRCGYSEGGISTPEINVWEYANNILKVMMNEWRGFTSELAISDEYHQRFNELTARLKEATSVEQVDYIFDVEFRALCDEAIANSDKNVYLNHWELNPNTIHVVAGTSVEELAERIVGHYSVTLYLSDGSTVNAPILYEMLMLDGLNLNEVGESELNIFFTYEQHSVHFNLTVHVDPDMSNATNIGSYNFVGDVYNGMEWDYVDLFDNGIAILYCEGDLEGYVNYALSEDGKFTYEMYGETLVYQINANGITFYKQDDVIGSYVYDEEGEGFTMTVYGPYTGYGEYYAYLEIVEYSSEGNEDRFAASTVVILDMENCEIYCGLIGGWMVYDENGFVAPKECEHTEIDEKGYCAQCGRNMNENNYGDIVVTPNVPSYDYTENGNDYIYNDGNYDYSYTDKVLDGNYVVTYN